MSDSWAAEVAILAARLREVMSAEGLTQKALESRVNVDQGAISRLLNRKSRRRCQSFMKLAEYVNMRASDVGVPQNAAAAFKRYVDVGGDISVLADAIDLLGEAHVRARRATR